MNDQLLLKRLAAMMLAGFVGATSLVGCSGEGGLGDTPASTTDTDTATDTGTDTDTDSGSGEDTDFNSVGTLKIIPFTEKETFQDHLPDDIDNPVPFFRGSFEFPSVNQYMVLAVNPSTNTPTTMTVADVAVFENGSASNVLIDEESQAFLTQISYLPVSLDIALVIDASASLDNTQFTKIKAGVSNLLESFKTASLPNVTGSQFTLWSYGSTSPFDLNNADEAPFWTPAATPKQLNYISSAASNFTDEKVGITNLPLPSVFYGNESDIDTLKNLVDAIPTSGRSSSTDLNGALMAAIGRYVGSGSAASGNDGGPDEACCNFRDGGGNGDFGEFYLKDKNNVEVYNRRIVESNDLQTVYSQSGIRMAAVILIAGSDDNASRFSQETLVKSLTAQTISRVFTGTDGLSILEKGMPVITAFTGESSDTTTNLQGISSQFLTTPSANITADAVDFSSVITALQQEITTRTSTDGVYVLNYATPLREGEDVLLDLAFAADTTVKILTGGLLDPGEQYNDESPNNLVRKAFDDVKPRVVIRGDNSVQFSSVEFSNFSAFTDPQTDMFFHDYFETKLGTTWTYCAETLWDFGADESTYNYLWNVTEIAGGAAVNSTPNAGTNCITVDNTTTVDYRVTVQNMSLSASDVFSNSGRTSDRDRLDVLN